MYNKIDELRHALQEATDDAAYETGRFIYTITFQNCVDSSCDVQIHAQWPVVKRVLSTQKIESVTISTIGGGNPLERHVQVVLQDSYLRYVTIVSTQTEFEELKELWPLC